MKGKLKNLSLGLLSSGGLFLFVVLAFLVFKPLHYFIYTNIFYRSYPEHVYIYPTFLGSMFAISFPLSALIVFLLIRQRRKLQKNPIERQIHREMRKNMPMTVKLIGYPAFAYIMSMPVLSFVTATSIQPHAITHRNLFGFSERIFAGDIESFDFATSWSPRNGTSYGVIFNSKDGNRIRIVVDEWMQRQLVRNLPKPTICRANSDFLYHKQYVRYGSTPLERLRKEAALDWNKLPQGCKWIVDPSLEIPRSDR